MRSGITVMDFKASCSNYNAISIYSKAYFFTCIYDFCAFPLEQILGKVNLPASSIRVDDFLQLFGGNCHNAAPRRGCALHVSCLLFRVDRKWILPVLDRLANRSFRISLPFQRFRFRLCCIVRKRYPRAFPLFGKPCRLAEPLVFRI